MKRTSARKPAKRTWSRKAGSLLICKRFVRWSRTQWRGKRWGSPSALAEEARKGELAHAKFLFEMIGLYPLTETPASEEDRDAQEGNDLARVLLQRLALQGSEEDAEETTELVGVTGTGDSVE
jgi:hypothetical protein